MLSFVLISIFQQIGRCQMVFSYQTFTQNSFSTSNGWSVIGGNAGFEVRDGLTIFGGSNVFGGGVSIYKEILISPRHHTIKLKMKIWAINTWDNESILTKVDGEIVDEQTVSSNKGNSFGQFIQQEIIIPHYSQSIILEITTTLQAPSSEKSWGVRDIYIYTYNCPVGCYFCTYLDTTVDQCLPYIQKINHFLGAFLNTNEGWMVTNEQISQFKCDQISTFGKYKTGTTITKEYFFEPHYEMRITFQFWKFDALTTSQYSLKVDEIVVWSDYKTKAGKIELCGSSTKPEQFYNVDLRIYHVNQYTTIKFVSDAITPTDYFGIRELAIFLLRCDASCELCEASPTTCITGTKLTENLLESDLTEINFATQSQWGSYTPSDATGQIKMPYLTETYFSSMNYLSFYNLLYKDFELEDHEKIKIQFQAYAAGEALNINLKIDEDYDEIVSIGETLPVSTCTPSLTYNIEDYSFWEYTFDHTGNFVRIQFESQPYISGNYKYGFNHFNIYSIKEDCTNNPCVQVESLINSNFFTTTFTDPQNWQLLSYSPMAISICGAISVVGGYNIAHKNIFLQKRSSISQPHKILRLLLVIYYLDSWTSNKSLRILADKVIIWDQTVDYNKNQQNFCSSNASYKDQMVTVDVSFPHNKASLTFQFMIMNGDGTEFYAIKNYQLFYSN
ncbi:unnamed protein product [Paramecium sonneborni]|uniref:Uncharacterized protein n=1 Tax=Paramecium sonneborni TaxID=65129 RepID=A0A8S1RGN9_9CILI|nr:unnamed protein product [Paramecium sonneborni]